MLEERAVTGIVIDAANGGDDTGATGNGIIEKDVNLEVSQYMYNRFQELNLPSALVRDNDETISTEERNERILSLFGNDSNVIVISNRLNTGGDEGAEVVYALRNTSALAQQVLEEIAREGQIPLKYYQRRLPENPAQDYYSIMRDTANTQPLIIRYGYVDNSRDAGKIKNDILNYAEGVVRAITQYVGGTYVPPEGSNRIYYTVQNGDSLWSIARKFNVTVSELRNANNLTTDVLQIGQILLIPTSPTEVAPPEGSITYIVKSGDSLWSIANKYNTTVSAIKEANNLTSNNLSIGQQLVIPSSTTNGSTNTYIVKSGDSLWSIANRFGLTVNELITANNLSTNVLQIGQILVIPSSDTTPNVTTYTVQSGDSLWSIAKKFSTTVDEIKSLNGLSSNTLSIGQVLKIPLSSSGDYFIYTVKVNDSLYKIALEYGTTVNSIKQLNDLTSDNLSIGQQLKIPT